ncbi:MAG: hypothetical protein ACSHX3_00550 [Litorimonas sp.]
MTDDSLKSLLADYVAPTEDQGFSDAVLTALQTQEEAALFDLDSLAKRPTPLWRSWMIALMIGLLCGLIWTRLGLNLLDISLESSVLNTLSTGWAAYGLGALCLAVCLLLVETEAF